MTPAERLTGESELPRIDTLELTLASAQPERARAARNLLTGILGLPPMVASRCVDID